MMLYVSSSLAWDQPVDQVFAQARRNGAEGIEIWAQQIWSNNNSHTLQELGKTGPGISVHAPSWDLNICSLNSQIQKASVGQIKKSIDMAAEIGAEIVVVHPGRTSINQQFRQYHQTTLEAACLEICQYARGFNLQIGIENMEPIKNEFIVEIDAVNSLINKIRQRGLDNVGCVLDIAHIPLEEDPLYYLQNLENILEVHLSDARPGKLHVPLGSGKIDLARVIPYLEKEFQGPVVLEGLEINDNYCLLEKNIKYYLKLAAEIG